MPVMESVAGSQGRPRTEICLFQACEFVASVKWRNIFPRQGGGRFVNLDVKPEILSFEQECTSPEHRRRFRVFSEACLHRSVCPFCRGGKLWVTVNELAAEERWFCLGNGSL